MPSAPNRIVDFFVIGAQKCGTTALDLFLRQVPGIQMAEVKEPHFFDDETIDWSTDAVQELHRFYGWQAGGAVMRGEATPIYSYWPNALERLHRYNPSAKLIMCLRHPGFRAYSHWHMETRRDVESRSFTAAIGDARRSGMVSSPQRFDRVFSYVERGFYSWQIERALSLFPRQQIHFIRSDRHWEQPHDTRRRALSFLGVEAVDTTTITKLVPRVTESMRSLSAATRAAIADLATLYADDIRCTEALTGLVLSDWLDERYQEPMGTASTIVAA